MNRLHEETIRRIEREADEKYPLKIVKDLDLQTSKIRGYHTAMAMGYITGATAEAERVRRLIEALKIIRSVFEDVKAVYNFIDEALVNYNR